MERKERFGWKQKNQHTHCILYISHIEDTTEFAGTDESLISLIHFDITYVRKTEREKISNESSAGLNPFYIVYNFAYVSNSSYVIPI